MDIQRTHHIDKSEPDEHGLYDYYYEYDIFEFANSDMTVVARSYADTPNEAHFLRKEIGGVHHMLSTKDINSQLIKKAIDHLVAQKKTEINWLNEKGNNGYERINT